MSVGSKVGCYCHHNWCDQDLVRSSFDSTKWVVYQHPVTRLLTTRYYSGLWKDSVSAWTQLPVDHIDVLHSHPSDVKATWTFLLGRRSRPVWRTSLSGCNRSLGESVRPDERNYRLSMQPRCQASSFNCHQKFSTDLYYLKVQIYLFLYLYSCYTLL